MPKSTKRYRILEPADWKQKHLGTGWVEKDGQLVDHGTGEPLPPFGIDYPPERRAVAGDVVSDLPAESIEWLLEAGYIEEVS